MVRRAIVVTVFLAVIATIAVLALVAGSPMIGLFFVLLACATVAVLPLAAHSRRRARGPEERAPAPSGREDEAQAPRRAA